MDEDALRGDARSLLRAEIFILSYFRELRFMGFIMVIALHDKEKYLTRIGRVPNQKGQLTLSCARTVHVQLNGRSSIYMALKFRIARYPELE